MDEALALEEPICLCFPDDTAAKRMSAAVAQISEQLGRTFPSVYGVKRRASSRETTLDALFGDLDGLKGATVLNLDDEIATGGTNINAAAELIARYGSAR